MILDYPTKLFILTHNKKNYLITQIINQFKFSKMKKILSVVALIMAISLYSCEENAETTYTSPFDGLKFDSYYCVGNSQTGEVKIGICAVNSNYRTSYYFGTLTAIGNGKTYTTGSIGYVGNVDLPQNTEVWVEYSGTYNTLQGIPNDLERFDSVVININVSNSGEVKQLEYKNMNITWE